MASRIEVYEDNSGEWRWKLVHANGNVMADSSEGYSSKQGCMKALAKVRGYMGNQEVAVAVNGVEV